jgi:hypothetical protein
MSRFTKMMSDGRVVAYGYDRALGYFIDVFKEAEVVGDLLIEEEVIMEKCSFFGSSNGDILEAMEEFGVDPNHIQAVSLDLEF